MQGRGVRAVPGERAADIELDAPTERSDHRPLLRVAIAVVALAVALPLFFEIYREAAFSTAPRDDYAPQLLALLGMTGDPPYRLAGSFDQAPFGYRALSAAVAIPFYLLIPAYEFTNLPVMDEAYLRATQALALVSYLSIVLTAFVVYRIATRRLSASASAGLIVAMGSVFLSSFIGRAGVDPLAILLISLGVYWLYDWRAFAVVVVVGAAFNEKVPLIFLSLMILRVVAFAIDRRTVRGFAQVPQLTATFVAIALYAAIRAVLDLPGNEFQTDPTSWLPSALSTLRDTLSLKGAVANGVPIALLATMAFLAYRARSLDETARRWFQPSDALVFPVLILVGFAINMQFTVGRLAMHTYPLYLPVLAVLVDLWLPSGLRRRVA